jgi:hypothetical protein
MNNFKGMNGVVYTGTFSLGCDLLCMYPDSESAVSQVLIAMNSAMNTLQSRDNALQSYEYRCTTDKSPSGESYLVILIVVKNNPMQYRARVCVHVDDFNGLAVFNDAKNSAPAPVGKLTNLSMEQALTIICTGDYKFNAEGYYHIHILEKLAIGTKEFHSQAECSFNIVEYDECIEVSMVIRGVMFFKMYLYFELAFA